VGDWRAAGPIDPVEALAVRMADPAIGCQAYGFRNHEFFVPKILALHEAEYVSVG
jgi:hypothetical protein